MSSIITEFSYYDRPEVAYLIKNGQVGLLKKMPKSKEITPK